MFNANSLPLRRVWHDILRELEESERRHPTHPADPLRRTALMCEESGEALKAALDLTRLPAEEQVTLIARRHNEAAELYVETVQTAAMAVRNLIAMREDSAQHEEKFR